MGVHTSYVYTVKLVILHTCALNQINYKTPKYVGRECTRQYKDLTGEFVSYSNFIECFKRFRQSLSLGEAGAFSLD